MSKEEISRRHFLKNATAGAVGVAAVSVITACTTTTDNSTVATEALATVENTTAPVANAVETAAVTEAPTTAAQTTACEPWYGSAPAIADSDIVETLETEILICGAGHAGMTAALAAAEQGAKTLVIEKNPSIGTYRTYVGGIGTAAQIAAGAEIDKNEIVNDIARYGSNHVDQKLIRVWADESAETIDWVGSHMANYGFTHVAEYDTGTGYHGAFKCWPTHTKFVIPGDEASMANNLAPSMQEEAEKLGAEFLFETPMIKLLREGDNSGKVTGVIAQNKDGKYIQINASKGILISTGGYADDADLFNRLNPCAASVTTMKWVQPGTKGDGIKAGIWAGGVKDKHPAAMLFDRGITIPGGKAGLPFIEGSFQNIFNIGSQPFLKVNMDGKRFICESAPYDFSLYPLENEKNSVYCMIWDANYWSNMESFHTMGCSRMVPSASVPATGEGPGQEATAALIAGNAEAGLVQQGDTLEELAAKLMLPPDAFTATIARYNELAAKGVDEDFGKPAKDLIALDTPPYYGATIGGWILTTMDGLLINTDMQVVDANRAPIEGLYAAGDTAGGFFAHNYPELAVGVACGKSMTFARHAVLHMLGKL